MLWGFKFWDATMGVPRPEGGDLLVKGSSTAFYVSLRKSTLRRELSTFVRILVQGGACV